MELTGKIRIGRNGGFLKELVTIPKPMAAHCQRLVRIHVHELRKITSPQRRLDVLAEHLHINIAGYRLLHTSRLFLWMVVTLITVLRGLSAQVDSGDKRAHHGESLHVAFSVNGELPGGIGGFHLLESQESRLQLLISLLYYFQMDHLIRLFSRYNLVPHSLRSLIHLPR